MDLLYNVGEEILNCVPVSIHPQVCVYTPHKMGIMFSISRMLLILVIEAF